MESMEESPSTELGLNQKCPATLDSVQMEEQMLLHKNKMILKNIAKITIFILKFDSKNKMAILLYVNIIHMLRKDLIDIVFVAIIDNLNKNKNNLNTNLQRPPQCTMCFYWGPDVPLVFFDYFLLLAPNHYGRSMLM